MYALGWGAAVGSVNSFTTRIIACIQQGVHQPTFTPPSARRPPRFPLCRAFNLTDPQATDEEPARQNGKQSRAELSANGAQLSAVAGPSEAAQDLTSTTPSRQ